MAAGYRETVRGLSDRIVDAQRPIRIREAVKWDDAFEERVSVRKSRLVHRESSPRAIRR